MGAVSGSRGVCKFWNSSQGMHAEACTSPVRRKPPLGGQAPHALRPVTEPREARAAAVTAKPLADCSFLSFPPRHLARRSTVREGATLKLLQVLPVPVSRRARRRPAVGEAAVLSDTEASTSFTSRVDDDTAILCQLCFITNITNKFYIILHAIARLFPRLRRPISTSPTPPHVMHLRPGSSSSARGLLIWATHRRMETRRLRRACAYFVDAQWPSAKHVIFFSTLRGSIIG